MRTVLLVLLLLVLPSVAGATCYWQAPVADNAANPPPYWIQRCDLGVLPIDNNPATIDRIEVINPGVNSQRYLPDWAQAIAPFNGVPALLNYILPFAPKRSLNIQLIFETQAPVFHFYSPSIQPYCIGNIPGTCPEYTVVNPAWANYARVWRTGHVTIQNFSMVMQLPPNTLPLGTLVKPLIDAQSSGASNHMWVISD